MRWLLPALIVLALVFAADVSVTYGGNDNVKLELNKGVVEQLTISIKDIPDENVSYIVFTPSSAISDRVYCAPSPLKVSGSTGEFTCVVVPGDAVEGMLVFTAYDANDQQLKETTVSISVSYRDVWHEARAVAKVGSKISLGPYTLTVKKASFLYALLVFNDTPVTAFINDETKVSDSLYVTYKGYDPDTHEVFFTFRSTYPISVSVEEKQDYLVAPRYVYPYDDNAYHIPIYTTCNKLEYRLLGSNEWHLAELDNNELTIETNVARVYIRCSGNKDLSAVIHLKKPPVKEVRTEVNAAEFCSSHGYVLESNCTIPEDKKALICATWATAHGYTKQPPKRPSSDHGSLNVLPLLVLVALAALLYYLHKNGKLKFPSLPKKSASTSPVSKEKPVEEAHEVMQ